MNIMQANPKIGSMDAVLDKLYGKVGSPEREEFRKEAYSYCVGQIISDARKQEKMTQSELAEKVGTNKNRKAYHVSKRDSLRSPLLRLFSNMSNKRGKGVITTALPLYTSAHEINLEISYPRSVIFPSKSSRTASGKFLSRLKIQRYLSELLPITAY